MNGRCCSTNARRRRFDLVKYLDTTVDDVELDDWIDGNIELDLEKLTAE